MNTQGSKKVFYGGVGGGGVVKMLATIVSRLWKKLKRKTTLPKTL